MKMFLRLYKVKRVLFLVDRLELEDQAKREFNEILSEDYQSVIWKENTSDWRKAEIVVSTVQSFISLYLISPPSLATAGLIFSSNILTIFFSISCKFSFFSFNSLSITHSLPFE